MALFTWKDEYSVKIEKIDGQHKKLVELLDQLHSSMLSAKADGVMGKILDELVRYTTVHFGEEEQLMKLHNYPGYQSQLEAHKIFIKKIEDFQTDFKEGKKMISVDLLYLLKDWLIGHINGVDKKYTEFFHDKGVN